VRTHGDRGVVRGAHGESETFSKIGAATGPKRQSEISTSETQVGYAALDFHKGQTIRKVLEQPGKVPGMTAWQAGMQGRSRNGRLSDKRHDACFVEGCRELQSRPTV